MGTMIRRVSTVSLVLCVGMVAISAIGLLHPQFIKFAKPGSSPLWLVWTVWGIRYGHASYVDSSRAVVWFTIVTARIDSVWLAIAFVVLPLSRLAAFWGGKRKESVDHPRCAVCGYDIRATPVRCPECGAFVRRPRR